MKKYLFLMFMMLVGKTGFSQITISQADLQSLVGKQQQQYNTASTPVFNLSQTGANQVWDFTTLTFNATSTATVSYYGVPPANAPYATDPAFAQANFTLKTDSAGAASWQYAKLSATGVQAFGGALRLTTIDTGKTILSPSLNYFGAFPLAYNAQWNSHPQVLSALVPAGMTGAIYDTTKIDGWGVVKILTPSGVVQKNVLRFRRVEVLKVSILIIPVLTARTEIYQWIGSTGDGYFVLAQAVTDTSGNLASLSYFSPLQTNVGTPQSASSQPKTFELSQNYPNPFNPTTVISYQLSVSSQIALKVYDILGREVAVLVQGWQSAGRHDVTFNAAALPSGLYFYRLQSGTQTLTRKMMLVK